MILIADSGSTKTDWVLMNEKEQFHYKTIGYNPYFVNSENIYHSINEKLITQFDPSVVKSVHFYGAGCSSDNNITIVNKALTRCFVNSKVSVGHDMLAAARALLGNKRGFAAIIGTGSNTCIYNGKDIEKNIDSLGYLLGDEGSGSYIGKKLIRDHLRGYLPPELEKKFREKYDLTSVAIFDSIYNRPLPNRFLAGFCEFADENKKHPYIKRMIQKAFDSFFSDLVSMYPNYTEYEFNCVGSVGYIFKDILEEVSISFKMKPGHIIHSPIDGLVNYHMTHNDLA